MCSSSNLHSGWFKPTPCHTTAKVATTDFWTRMQRSRYNTGQVYGSVIFLDDQMREQK